jgi:hypothetical protein
MRATRDQAVLSISLPYVARGAGARDRSLAGGWAPPYWPAHAFFVPVFAAKLVPHAGLAPFDMTGGAHQGSGKKRSGRLFVVVVVVNHFPNYGNIYSVYLGRRSIKD